MKGKIRRSVAAKTEYQPTAREQNILRDHVARNAEAAPRIIVVDDKEAATVSTSHPDKGFGFVLLADAVGTSDGDFLNGLLRQVINASSPGQKISESAINFMLAIIKDVKPNDQIEAMLAAQMAAVHMATMRFAERLAHVENMPQQDSAERAFNKLARTFTTQMEALKRYRSGGEQKVTVQHVSVSEGGQAIVGNVTQGTRESAAETPAHSTPSITDARQPVMPTIDKPEQAPVAVRRTQKDGRKSST